MSKVVGVITRSVYVLAGVLALLIGIVPLLTGTASCRRECKTSYSNSASTILAEFTWCRK